MRGWLVDFASLDFSPWTERLANGWLLPMVTLTYPDHWHEFAPTARHATRHLETFKRRLKRALGETPLALVKKEFTARPRQAVHFHIFVALPPTISGETMESWLRAAWYEVVGSGDPKHLLHGVHVSYRLGLRAVDPVRAARYFTKHGAASGHSSKEYQNHPPDRWVETGSVGRFWLMWGLQPAERTVSLTLPQLFAARRILRGVHRAKGLTHVETVRRTHRLTGEVYLRRVTRRSTLGHLASGRLVGGSLFVPDGPEFSRVLARYLRAENDAGRLDPRRVP